MDLFGEPDNFTTADSHTAPAGSLPEPEHFTHPRAMPFCLGHEARVEKSLLDLYESGRLPHAMIFAGPRGVGKATMAYRFSRFLLKNPPADTNQDSLFAPQEPGIPAKTLDVPPDDPVFRRVAAGGHPDLLSVERVYDAIKNKTQSAVAVDEIRKVAPFLRMTAAEGGWRVVIIDDADTMNRSAQNALLKILEEPPEHTVLILVAHRPGALIPTIRSRARLIRFDPLSPEVLDTLLERRGGDLTLRDRETLACLAEGSFGRALSCIETGGLEVFDRVLTLFSAFPAWDWPEIYGLADELARNGNEARYQNFREMLLWIFQKLVLFKARPQQDHPGVLWERDGIRECLQKSSLESLLEICENLESHFNDVERSNLDKRQAVSGAFSIVGG